jgi:putative CocE/NonD family hydrolase
MVRPFVMRMKVRHGKPGLGLSSDWQRCFPAMILGKHRCQSHLNPCLRGWHMARHAVIWSIVAVVYAGVAGCVDEDVGRSPPADERVVTPDPDSRGTAPAGSAPGSQAGDAGGATTFSDTDVFEGEYQIGGSASRVLVPGPFSALPPEVTTLTASDGVGLSVGLMRPDTPLPVPVILVITLWYPPMTPENFATLDFGATSLPWLIENFLPHGYAIAALSLRGSGASGGCTGLFTPQEIVDFRQVVNHFATQPWSSGAVALYGLSIAAVAQWATVSDGNEHVKTIIPIHGAADVYTAAFRNGTASPGILGATADAFGIANVNRGAEAAVRQDPLAAAAAGDPRGCDEVVAATAAQAAQNAADPSRGDSVFWKQRAYDAGAIAHWRGSILMVQAFQDGAVAMHNAEPLAERLIDAGFVVKRVYHNGLHNDHPDALWSSAFTLAASSPPATLRWDWAEIVLHWLDHFLKGEPTDLGPAVQVADTDGAWRSEPDWPPVDAAPVHLFLGDGGALAARAEDAAAAEIPIGPDPSWHIPYDAADTAGEDCPLCAVFRTAPFEQTLRFAGAPRLPIQVTPLAPHGVVTARLYAEGEDGTRLLTWAQMDLRFSNGGDDQNQVVLPLWHTYPRIAFEPVDAVLHAGERLRLVVAQGPTGAMDNPVPGAFQYRGVPAPAALLVVGGKTSALVVDAFERAPGDLIAFPWD